MNTVFDSFKQLIPSFRYIEAHHKTTPFQKNLAKQFIQTLESDLTQLDIELVTKGWSMTWEIVEHMQDRRFRRGEHQFGEKIPLKKRYDKTLLQHSSDINRLCASILTIYHTPSET